MPRKGRLVGIDSSKCCDTSSGSYQLKCFASSHCRRCTSLVQRHLLQKVRPVVGFNCCSREAPAAIQISTSNLRGRHNIEAYCVRAKQFLSDRSISICEGKQQMLLAGCAMSCFCRSGRMRGARFELPWVQWQWSLTWSPMSIQRHVNSTSQIHANQASAKGNL